MEVTTVCQELWEVAESYLSRMDRGCKQYPEKNVVIFFTADKGLSLYPLSFTIIK